MSQSQELKKLKGYRHLMINTIRIITGTIVILAFAGISGCAETSLAEATGKGHIRGINSIVTAPELVFLIEERAIGTADYKGAAGFAEYDDLTYNFNFDVFLPGATTASRLATQTIDVVADTDYTVVIAGTVANPTIISWEAAERVFEATETVFEADFTHLSPALGEVDIYFAAAGTLPVAGNATTSLNYGERVPHLEFATGDFELIITPKDDDNPANYIFQSRTISSTPATRVTFAIFDADPSITADVSVNLINAAGGSASLPDATKPAQFRLFHAAFGTGSVDAFLDSDFGNVVFSNTPYGEVSSYSDIESVSKVFTLTDAGNSGATVHEANISIGANSRRTIIFGGEPGALAYRELTSDGRSLETHPIVRITNMATNAALVNAYMLPPGTVITEETLPQIAGFPTFADTDFFGLNAGMYEVTITPFGEITPISTPVTIDIANGDVVDIAVLDTVDPALVDLEIFDSTLP